MRELELRPVTAREALLQIQSIVAMKRPLGRDADLVEINNVARAGLDLSAPTNFELIDTIADYFAAAIEVLRKLREPEPEHESLLSEIDGVLALPPDLEAMVERRVGGTKEHFETAEEVRLQFADLLIEMRGQVLRKMAVEEKPKVRTVLGEMDELIQATFELFAPERWKEELEKAEAARARGEDNDAIEVMAIALARTRAREWDDVPDSVREGFRQQARAAWEAYGELGREREDALGEG